MRRPGSSRTVARVRLASVLSGRLRSLAPEASAFALIGAANSVLYFVIFNLAITIGAVKATVLATVVTTTLSYLANRHWTYRSRPRSARRREYSLFFGFNLVGMLIQSSVVGFVKYGMHLDESRHRLLFNLATVAGIGMATLFRFWAYRTLVFRPHPADHPAPTNAVEVLAEAIEEQAEFEHLTATLAADLDGPGFASRSSTARASTARDLPGRDLPTRDLPGAGEADGAARGGRLDRPDGDGTASEGTGPGRQRRRTGSSAGSTLRGQSAARPRR